MALVAYGNSDSSDYEDEENENAAVNTLITKLQAPGPSTYNQETKKTIERNAEDGPSLFNLLPQPSTKKPTVIEEDDEFLHKKEKVNIVKPKAKITVPSLRDFRDVDSPTLTSLAKPKVANGKKSGLLSILPQPRNGFTTTTSKSLLPHVLQQKNNGTIKKKTPIPSPAKKQKNKLLNDYSDESDNEEVTNDFFSINKPVEIPNADIPLDIDQNLDEDVPASTNTGRSKLESYFKQDPIENLVAQEIQPMEGYEDYASSEAGSSYSNGNADGECTSNGDIELDDEAILKLCGTRGKRKREDIQIVDVKQQDVLADAREWLLKGLMDDTTKRVSSSKRRGNEPTSQQKRKHQITYLAHQAKANESELQNQWANSRMSRRQTQNKYGF